MEDRADSLAVRASALAGDGHLIRLEVKLGLVGAGEMRGSEHRLHCLTELGPYRSEREGRWQTLPGSWIAVGGALTRRHIV